MGFTLVELLAVITILAIILVIAIPNIQHLIDEKKKDTFLINAKSIIKQIKYEDRNFLTTQLSELNLEGIAKDGYDADLSTAYISDEEIHLNLVGAGQYKGMYLCGVNLTTNKSEVQNTPCEELEKYIVTFDPNGGSVGVSSKEVIYNSTYGNLPIPKREGYKFLGWNGKNKFNKENYLLMDDYHQPALGYSVSKIYLSANTTYHFSVVRYNGFDGMNNEYLLIDNTSSGNSHWSAIAHPTWPNECTVTGCNYTTGTDGLLYIARHNTITQTNLDTIWANTDVQLEEGTEATEYEPYYVTKDVKVTQRKNHTLKAIWEEI